MADQTTQESAEHAGIGEWPKDGLESVAICPACGSQSRRILFSQLHDNVFSCAPGTWILHRCLECASAFLDPRPTPKTIHLAYLNYHTHQTDERIPTEDLKGIRYLQRVLADGYRNWRFNTTLSPSSRFGVPVAFLLPFQRAAIDHELRDLPRPPQNGRLLDVGFGNGAFMEKAHAMGWKVTGIDPDPEVVNSAQLRGLDVHHGDLETLSAESNIFDVITLSHVIEHLQSPMAALEACYRLLKPGGILWVETPNIDSLGHLRFQHNWRGLEPPRHLVIFNRSSLRQAVVRAGFTAVKDASQTSPCYFIYTSSQRMAQGLDPYENKPAAVTLKAEIIVTKFLELLIKSRREFVSIKATKPGRTS